jgi:hypothetical protein
MIDNEDNCRDFLKEGLRRMPDISMVVIIETWSLMITLRDPVARTPEIEARVREFIATDEEHAMVWEVCTEFFEKLGRPIVK